MEAIHKGSEIFDVISCNGSGTNNVVDISLVQGRCSTRVLIKDLFLDMAHKQESIVRPKAATHGDSPSLSVILSIEGESIQCES